MSVRHVRRLLLLAGAALAGPMAIPGRAADSADPGGVEFFVQKIEPIFVEHCYKCHGNGKDKGGLSFYTRDGLLQGGDSGPAIDLESPGGSLILDAVNYESLEMPPSGKLPAEQRELIARWVEMGAPVPDRADVKTVHQGVPQVSEETKSHWAFRPLVRPSVPDVAPETIQNPIDAFIVSRLHAAGLAPNPPADRRTLARRLYYDLLGLPPTPEQVAAFVADDSPDAYLKLVNTLLDSPHYGEHWARYWLDLVRYAESNSFERDNTKPFVWKYRDYVIRAFNSDKPYDQFIREQLAGDELPQVTPESVIATGYYRLGPWDDEPADARLAFYDELDDIITTTGQGFLGLTINCARCHDHKLDPIPQADYYSFLSFFQNIKRFGIRSDDSVYDHSVRIIASQQEQDRYQSELKAYKDRVKLLRDQIDVVDNRIAEQLTGGEKDDFKRDSVRLSIIFKLQGKLISGPELDDYARTRREWESLKKHPPQVAEQALAVKENGSQPEVTHLLIRGSPEAEGDVVEPLFPAILSPPAPEITTQAESSGRRLALANWIASPENPLTARVMANRLWQWHFDRGLVRSASNFGLQGDLPTHPQLLDWLAAEFIRQGWSIKGMHRLILTSRTYQMSSAANPAALQKDPQNDFFWRYDMRRLRAEEVRDSILAVNHTLDLKRLFGPSIYPVIPEAVLAGQSRPGDNWHTSAPEDRCRRSIYIHLKRSLQVPLLASFDVADTDSTCPVRFATTQPTQALGMLNSEFLNEQARFFADDVKKSAGNDLSAQIRLALRQVAQREPTTEELARGLALVKSLREEHGQSSEESLKNFCLLALNLNEFIYLD